MGLTSTTDTNGWELKQWVRLIPLRLVVGNLKIEFNQYHLD